jgi:hypothetical protein
MGERGRAEEKVSFGNDSLSLCVANNAGHGVSEEKKMQDTVVKKERVGEGGTSRSKQANKIPGARTHARDVSVAHPFALSSREIMSL